jgi:hypothetical protein
MRQFWTRLTSPRTRPFWAYLAVALVILGPALLPGYILTLDMVFTPQLHLNLGLTSQLPFNLLLTALNVILPGWLIQKLLLLTIFTLAGLGLHRLAPTSSPVARYAAGLFYVINPFTYERLMAGQYLVLAGYALLPWFLAALLRWLHRPSPRTAAITAAWAVAISLIYLHGFGFVIGLIILAVLIAGIKTTYILYVISHSRHSHPAVKPLQPRPTNLRPLLTSATLMAAIILAASSFWLVPLLAHHTPQSQLIASFDERHFLSFRSQPDPHLGLPGGTLALSGFWGERDHFATPWPPPYYLVTLAILAALMLTGLLTTLRRHRTPALILLVTLIVSWVLAQGIMDNPFAPLNHWLFDHLPLYRGYRDPGKFLALIALAEAYFLAAGLATTLSHLRRRYPSLTPTAAILLLALPILATPTLIWGANHQLRATHYPADWPALARTLTAHPADTQVLVLPWHQYLYLDFAGRLIANPAAPYFGPRVIQGDNAEIGLIAHQTTDPTATFIEQQILDPTTGRTALAARLRSRHITHILLLKGAADTADYAWLDHQPDLVLTRDSQSYQLYRTKPLP